MDKWFLHTGRLEALSFLGLLLIAMPVKYYAGMPGLVRILGPVHGGLFVAYIALAFLLFGRDDWSFKKLMFAILASVIPCGTFWFERAHLKETSQKIKQA